MFTGVSYLIEFSETVRDDEEFLTSLLHLGVYSVYTAASTRLQQSRDFAFKCLCADIVIYSYLSESLRGKYELLLFVADKNEGKCTLVCA
jgi:aspartate carbamoyltransferase catalytic subunit